MKIRGPQVRARDLCRCARCGRAGYDPQHRLRRSQGGLWEWANMITLCRVCHDWADDARNLAEAVACGLRIMRDDPRDPSQIPVVYHLLGAPVLLGNDGTVKLAEAA